MGFPWRRILNIGTDVAAVLIPGGAQIDAAVDALTRTKGKSNDDDDRIKEAISAAKLAKAAVESYTPAQKGMLESKRMKAAIVNALGVLAIYIGLDPAIADQVALAVSVPLLAFILGESVRPSLK
jgi:hypothetical protein